MNKTPDEKFDDSIQQVCTECGISANVITCLYRFAAPPKKLAFSISIVHKAKCDFCKKVKMVTEARDFFYPMFSVLKLAMDTSPGKKRKLKTKKK